MRASPLVLVVLLACAWAYDDGEDFTLVTCQSTVKLRHKSGYHLHSHDINWGSGSGQQSVTAHKDKDDFNSFWTIMEANGQETCLMGEPIKCGSTVRLVHHKTRKFLHSHMHASPVSHRLEVSCFGNADDRQSDDMDNWKVECETHSGYWQRDAPVQFLHLGTGACLIAQKDVIFNRQNCRNCPIQGQLEVSSQQNCKYKKSADMNWKTNDGIFYPKWTEDYHAEL